MGYSRCLEREGGMWSDREQRGEGERRGEGRNGGNNLDFSKCWAKYIICLFK